MNGNPALKLLRLSLFSVAWLACSTFLGAQQNSGAMTGSGLAPTSAASPMTGVYSIESGGVNRESAFANRLGSTASYQTGKFNNSSTWTSGEISRGGANSAAWIAGEANFRERSASSWIAGAGNFKLAYQQGGIWRESVGPGAQSNTSVTSVESNDSFYPLALTSKGTALIKGAGLTSSYAGHAGTAFGVPGSGSPFAARRGFGSMNSHFGSKAGGFRSVGDGSGSKPGNLVTPSSGTLNGPTIDDAPGLNEGLGSEKTSGSNELDSTSGTLH